MSERNVTVALSIDCKVAGGAAVQDIGQFVAGMVELHSMTLSGRPYATRVTPLRVELERAHERRVA